MSEEEFLPPCGAIIVGGGSGRRFGGDKLSIPISGVPLLAWSLEAFQHAVAISSIVVVAPAGKEEKFCKIAEASGITKLSAVVSGGGERHVSVLRGLEALPPHIELVAIHDAARPLVTPDLITRCLLAAEPTGAAAAAAPVTDTLHLADEEGFATRTVDRSGLWAMQTPQVFLAEPLRKLLAAKESGVPTDEVATVLEAGWKVPFVKNLEPNIKVTWPEDFELAELLLNSRPPYKRVS